MLPIIFRTAEEIAELADHKDGRSNIVIINRLYRQQDESNCYPVFGRFNVTEQAIRKARKIQKNSDSVYGLEYCLLLEGIMSDIVNS